MLNRLFKKFLLPVFMAALSPAVVPRLASAEAVTAVMATISSTRTTVGMDISSAPATNIIVSTTAVWRQACVQNLDITAFLACGENILVSTLTSHALAGTFISPATSSTTFATPTCFSVLTGSPFYCRSSSVTGTTRASVSRGR